MSIEHVIELNSITKQLLYDMVDSMSHFRNINNNHHLKFLKFLKLTVIKFKCRDNGHGHFVCSDYGQGKIWARSMKSIYKNHCTEESYTLFVVLKMFSNKLRERVFAPMNHCTYITWVGTGLFWSNCTVIWIRKFWVQQNISLNRPHSNPIILPPKLWLLFTTNMYVFFRALEWWRKNHTTRTEFDGWLNTVSCISMIGHYR